MRSLRKQGYFNAEVGRDNSPTLLDAYLCCVSGAERRYQRSEAIAILKAVKEAFGAIAENTEPLEKPGRHSTERGSAGSTSSTVVIIEVDPALPRSVLCLPG